MTASTPTKTCIVIAGPTAVGKTNVAVNLALHFKTSIISADSRQCFKELNIGVAKPTAEQLNKVKHYFINSHSIADDVNAGSFEQYALKAVNEIFLEHNVAIMVGGTGLYIKAFCEGMDEIPAADANLRERINKKYAEEGIAWLQQEIKQRDPAWYASGEIQNPQRIMRALEVVMHTGRSILSFHQPVKAERNFRIIKVGLTLPREELYRNINTRVDEMIKDGLVEEVRSLVQYRKLNALQTVGYKEIFEYLDGAITLNQAIENLKKNTRHYAKRQLTWFNKDEAIQWFSPVDYGQLIAYFNNLV